MNPYVISGPVHVDKCNHPPSSYVRSFEYVYTYGPDRHTVFQRVDLYVFDSQDFNNNPIQEVCLRFGDECSDYYSPGQVQNVFELADRDHLYGIATSILKEEGILKWVKKEKNT